MEKDISNGFSERFGVQGSWKDPQGKGDSRRITRGGSERRTRFESDKETSKEQKGLKVSISDEELNNTSGLSPEWDSKRSGAIYPVSGVFSGISENASIPEYDAQSFTGMNPHGDTEQRGLSVEKENLSKRAQNIHQVQKKKIAEKKELADYIASGGTTMTGQQKDKVLINPELDLRADNRNNLGIGQLTTYLGNY